MRDRLIKLLKRFSLVCRRDCDKIRTTNTCKTCHFGQIADYILADGWIRPPCKVGDTFYAINETSYCDYEVYGFMWCKKPDEDKISLIAVTVYGMTFIWGEEAFLTREEAEAKLKEGAQG